MSKKLVKYHYTECGLPNVWIWCHQAIDDAGKRVTIIPKIGRLHKLIARKIIESDGALTGDELKFLRSEIGATPEQFGKLIRRTGDTISRWEREERKMDGIVEAFIRVLVASKLNLNEIDPEDAVKKYTPTRKTKKRITINVQNSNYRLAA